MGPTSAARFGTLASIVEVKRTLGGTEKRFSCHVLARHLTHLVVLFVAPGPMHVHGVALPAGTVTFGHFWTDRPYNVYHWMDGATGATIGYYVNLADDTRIDGALLEWRDLAVDVLLRPNGQFTVLDEHEIPADASPALIARIAAAKAAVLDAHPALVAELEHHRALLWPTRDNSHGHRT